MIFHPCFDLKDAVEKEKKTGSGLREINNR
jgi:hypothetical protein